MLQTLIKNDSISNHRRLSSEKKQIELTGTLTCVLRPGACATYLYRGNIIRTSIVIAILEAAPDYVRFETKNSIYTITYSSTPVMLPRFTA